MTRELPVSNAPTTPSRACCACSRLPSVALIPHSMICGLIRFKRASASCNCTPRLLPISSCHSSTTTAATFASSPLASARASIKLNDSGVVSSAVGQRAFWRARSAVGVSPVRMPSVQCGSKSSSGAFSARWVSAARARIGVIQSTDNGGAALRRLAGVLVEDGAAGEAAEKAASEALLCRVKKYCSMPSQTA